MGETPIEIEEPEEIESILFQAEGYKNMFKMLKKEDKEIHVEMLKDNKSNIITARDLFYVNLAVFTLSLIGTAFAGTLYNESSELYNMASDHLISKRITPKTYTRQNQNKCYNISARYRINFICW